MARPYSEFDIQTTGEDRNILSGKITVTVVHNATGVSRRAEGYRKRTLVDKLIKEMENDIAEEERLLQVMQVAPPHNVWCPWQGRPGDTNPVPGKSVMWEDQAGWVGGPYKSEHLDWELLHGQFKII